MRPLLLATDYSPASGAAFEQALELARDQGAPLVLAHVLETPIPYSPDGYVLPRIYDEVAVAIRAEAEKRMRALLARARKARVPVTGLLLNGPPHEAVVRLARSRRASQIVVGTHGRKGVSKLFFGSVAARIVAASPCPVLVVPAQRRRRRPS